MRKKFNKIITSIALLVVFIATVTGTTYGMTLYGHYNISTLTKTGIRAWAYKSSPYKSASAKVTEGNRSSGWKKGRDVTATITNYPILVSKTYYKYNK